MSGEEYVQLKAKLARTQQVLTDLIAERSPADVEPGLLRDIARWIEHAPKLKEFLDRDFQHDYDYDARDWRCSFCEGAGNIHDISASYECPLLTLWKAIDPERYQKTIDSMFERWCEQEQRRERAEREVRIVSSPYTRDGEAYLFSENPAGHMEQVRSLLNTNMLTEEQARALLTTDQTLPETQGAHIARHRERQREVLGIDFGSQDGSAIVVGHTEGERLVVDDVITETTEMKK